MRDTLAMLAHFIERQRDERDHLCHLLLSRQENTQTAQVGYRLLAALLRAGYFSVVVTLNTDTLLEQALAELGVFPPVYRVLILGQDTDEKVALALDGQEPGISIVKIPPHKGITFAAEVQDSLASYLRANIAVVGQISELPHAMLQTLTVNSNDNRIFYIVPNCPADDALLERMQRQYKQYDNFIIRGTNGDFATFFRNLATHLLAAKDAAGNGRGPVLHTAQEATQPIEHPPAELPLEEYPLEEYPLEEYPLEEYPLEEFPVEEGRVLDLLPQRNSADMIAPRLLAYDVEESLGADSGPLTLEMIGNDERSRTARLPWPARVDVLIVTVTDIEFRVIRALNPQRVRRTIEGKTYYDLGFIGRARTFAVQANNMGPIDAHVTVDEGIRALRPRAVIMIGIAFGVRSKGQEIGDVLVSKLIHEYDLERVGTDADKQILNHARGVRLTASDWLIDRFIAINHDWEPPPAIHFGSILSGSKLVDNQDYLDDLLRSAPDAIGGEMEGIGLSKAANRHKVDWLLVKGVSDWGDGNKGENKDENQRLAAGNAARFVLFVLGQDDFLHHT